MKGDMRGVSQDVIVIKGNMMGGNARGRSRCDQFSDVISWNISMHCQGVISLVL